MIKQVCKKTMMQILFAIVAVKASMAMDFKPIGDKIIPGERLLAFYKDRLEGQDKHYYFIAAEELKSHVCKSNFRDSSILQLDDDLSFGLAVRYEYVHHDYKKALLLYKEASMTIVHYSAQVIIKDFYNLHDWNSIDGILIDKKTN